jgi:chemotaxis protein MotB
MKSRLLWLMLALTALGGCVTSGKYDAKVAELDKLNAEHAQKVAQLSACESARGQLDTSLGATRQEYEACKKATEAASQYTEQLKQRETDLRDRLQKELTDKDVVISRLKDQLSVQVLDKILFKSGSADILPAGQAVLDKLAAVLATTDDMIRVEGHTDNVPIGGRLKEKYVSNWELSAARAASVVRFFESGKSAIAPLRLEPVGYSQYRPVAPNDDDANRQRNRRVEIVLTAVKPAAEPAPVAPKP